ncbi:MAG: hypothetical protein U5K31_00620 [Balneolaceae bacterium]|nr:hypothetical protein [Balneolaceae bacterium]
MKELFCHYGEVDFYVGYPPASSTNRKAAILLAHGAARYPHTPSRRQAAALPESSGAANILLTFPQFTTRIYACHYNDSMVQDPR